MIAATAAGYETWTEWLAATSSTVEPARSDIICWAGGGIIRSSVVRRYQLGLFRQAGSLIVPPRASTPHGTGGRVGRKIGKARVYRLALVRREGRDVDERRHIGVSASPGDHRPAVGVADKNDRFALRVDDALA
jgi:hypothetical protein